MTDFTLKSIRLVNFKKHRELEIEFSEGITAIKGPNYAGKSTVTQAIFFALFGATAVPGGRSVIANSEGGMPCVQLYFLLDGKPHSITRSLGTATVFNPDLEILATGHTSVNSWVEDIFGLPQKLVLLLSRSAQGQTSALVTLGAAELNRIIESVANAKQVDEWASSADRLAVLAKAKLEALGPLGPDTLEGLSSSIQGYEEAVSLGKAKEEELKLSLAIAKQEEEDAQALLKEGRVKARKAAEVENLRSSLSGKISALLSSLTERQKELDLIPEQAPDLELKKLKLLGLERSLKDWNTSYSDLIRKSGILKAKENELSLLKKEEEKEVNVPEFKAVSERMENLRLVCSKEGQIFEELRKQFESLEADAKACVCSSCHRPFDEKHLEEVKKKLPDAKEAAKKAFSAFNSTQKELQEVYSKYEALKKMLPIAGYREAIETLSLQIEKLKGETDLETTEKRIVELDREIQVLKKDVTIMELALKAREEATQKVASYKASLEKLVQERDSLEVIEAPDMEALDHNLQTKSKIKYEATTALSSHVAYQKTVKDILEEMKRRHAELKQKIEKVEALEVRASRFSSLCSFLRKNKAAFLSDLWDGILSACSEFCMASTNGVITEVTRDEEGNFSYVENGQTFPAEAASGGQQSIMGVGLRLALASLLPQGCRLVTLDEPTGDLNDEHAAMLTSALAGQGRQVIMVTHREGDEIMADSVVTL